MDVSLLLDRQESELFPIRRKFVWRDRNGQFYQGVLISHCGNVIQPVKSITKLPVQLTNQLDEMVKLPVKARICELYSTYDISNLKHDGSNEEETSTLI